MSAESIPFGEVQQRFVDALLDRRDEAAIVKMISGEAEVAGRRMALYRGNLTGHWNSTLSAAYPVLRELVGEDCFYGLCRAYGKQYPSTSGDLNRFGDRFPEFLAQFEPVRPYGYFPDVARIEWAAHLAHYAANDQPLTPALLAQFSGETIDELRLSLRGSVALVETDWNAADIWRVHKAGRGATFSGAIEGKRFALVTRRSWIVAVDDLSPGAFAALSSVQCGWTFGQALLLALDVEPDIDIDRAVRTWLSHGIFKAKPSVV